MKTDLSVQIYASMASLSLVSMANFSKYDLFWAVFSLGGIFIMVGHQIYDQKIKHSAGKITWMILTSLITCFFIKILYDEGTISTMTMIVLSLVVSMIAPATFSIALKDLPDKVAEQILSLPEWFFNFLKNKVDKNGNSN